MVDILECTLRDASYPISYQFTAEDTAIIATGLHQAGFTRIEIGHGLGLGASGRKYGFAAATDEEYISAASSVLPPGIFGVFVIPGIADIEGINLVARYKGGFVRIGTDVLNTHLAEAFIKKGKDAGLEVSANLMKTYTASVTEVVERSLQMQEWGADIIAVVDSAGGMMPDSVRDYISSLSAAGVKRVGFHGHNNLQLAVANSLIAIEAGADIVDSTLRGLGRSSGNAQTEALIMCLERMGYKTGIDIFEAMDISEKIIAPLARGRGSDSIEIASGYSLFHSGYMPILEKVAKTKGVDIRRLIIAVGDGNGKSIDEELVSEIANSLDDKTDRTAHFDTVKNAVNSFQTKFFTKVNTEPNILTLASEINSISKKTGKTSVLTITKSFIPLSDKLTVPFIRSTDTLIIGNIELNASEEVHNILKEIDGLVDYILIDDSLNIEISENSNNISKVLTYSEANAQVNALEAYLSNLNPAKSGMKYLISGINPVSLAFAERLIGKNIAVSFYDDSQQILDKAVSLLNQRVKLLFPSSEVEVTSATKSIVYDGIIGFSESLNFNAVLSKFNPSGFIIDANIGSFTNNFIKEVRKFNLPVYRLDMRAGLASEVSLRLESYNLITNVFGKNIIDEIPVVAGGLVGELGMVVLDSLYEPSKVLGIADGRGGLLPKFDELPYSKTIDRIKNHILVNLLP
jgi:4-hydroxy-2-oxovalerate aldolase